jgi:hypothetical protein
MRRGRSGYGATRRDFFLNHGERCNGQASGRDDLPSGMVSSQTGNRAPRRRRASPHTLREPHLSSRTKKVARRNKSRGNGDSVDPRTRPGVSCPGTVGRRTPFGCGEPVANRWSGLADLGSAQHVAKGCRVKLRVWLASMGEFGEKSFVRKGATARQHPSGTSTGAVAVDRQASFRTKCSREKQPAS